MTSETKMIVPYEWILENVEEEPMTIASKMISFRGEKVFRVCLKNHARSPVLFFVVFDLNKIGMTVEDVTYRIQGSGSSPATMKNVKIGHDGSLQLFKTVLDKQIVGSWTFAFRIVITGTSELYSYQLSDRRAKNQLWAALEGQRNLSDVEFIVKDKSFPAHKAILTARSEPFASQFERSTKDGPYQIRIDGVEPSTVENFLHFIYTGESKGTLANEELLKLADDYGLTTLTALCHDAVRETEATQMTKLMECLNNGAGVLYPSKIMPKKDTEITFEQTPTFRCTLQFDSFDKSEIGSPTCIMKYQKEDLFFAYITGHFRENRISKPLIHFTCAKHRRFGLKVVDIHCSLKGQNKWFKMEPKKLKNSAELIQHFTFKWKLDFTCSNRYLEFNFDINTVSTIGNYYYEMMDDDWLKNFWTASKKQKFTDVEIFIGTVKIMEAHRVILSARSPVLNIMLKKISNTEKSIVTFGEEFDIDIVHYFLKFLYTGRLKTSAKVKQMSQLATMYKVETLKNICQLLSAKPPDGEELTNFLLDL